MCCYTHNLHRDAKKISCTVVFKACGVITDSEYVMNIISSRMFDKYKNINILYWINDGLQNL